MRETGIFLDELADFVAVAHRHEDVGKDQIGVRVGQAAHCGLAVANSDDFHAAFLKREHDHFLDISVVVRNQNSGHFNPPGGKPPHEARLALNIPIAAPRSRGVNKVEVQECLSC